MRHIVDTLVQLGLSENAAMLACVLDKGESFSKQLEKQLKLSQPAISLALKELEAHGWLAKRRINNGCRGRPISAYTLTLSLSAIIDALSGQKLEEINKMVADAQRIKEMVDALS